jgi:hypothetical protein
MMCPKLFFIISLVFTWVNGSGQHQGQEIPEIGIREEFNLSFTYEKDNTDSFRDVELRIWLKSPEGRRIHFLGFYDDNKTWEIRISPDEGLEESSNIVIGRLFPDGRLFGLNNY